jgi:hypothetical protein
MDVNIIVVAVIPRQEVGALALRVALHLGVLKWARENGYNWDRWEFRGAVYGGHLEIEGETLESETRASPSILKWLLNNGFVLTLEDYMVAENSQNLEIKEWIKEIESP